MDRPTKKFLANGWLYLPAVSGPLGGLMIKLGGGSVWAAVVVGAAPCAVCMLPYSVFLIGYITVLIKWVCSGPKTQDSMERLIAISANSVVAILSLTRVSIPSRPKVAERTDAEQQQQQSPSTTVEIAEAPPAEPCGGSAAQVIRTRAGTT
jgi:hypothetical protein